MYVKQGKDNFVQLISSHLTNLIAPVTQVAVITPLRAEPGVSKQRFAQICTNFRLRCNNIGILFVNPTNYYQNINC